MSASQASGSTTFIFELTIRLEALSRQRRLLNLQP